MTNKLKKGKKDIKWCREREGKNKYNGIVKKRENAKNWLK